MSAHANHTPGPWKWEGYSLVPVNRDPSRHHVHTIMELETRSWSFCGAPLHETGIECDANMRLIESSPALFELLETMLELRMLDAGGLGPFGEEAMKIINYIKGTP